MHPVLTDMIVKQVRQRRDEGDCPTIPAESVERLEDAIIDLASRLDAARTGQPTPHDLGKPHGAAADTALTVSYLKE